LCTDSEQKAKGNIWYPLEKIFIRAGSDVSSDWGRKGLILLKSVSTTQYTKDGADQ
jgi:hypothetical protein